MAWTLPWLRPFLCDIEANPSSHFMVWVDHRTEGAGSTGEHSPKWVEQPLDESPLEADLLAGRLPDRLDRVSLPEGAQAQAQVLKSLDSTWQVESEQAFTATFQTYYFPGWSVRVDGQPVPIAPAPVVGLIEAGLPAGKHVVNLRLDATPTQTVGNTISIVTALIVLAVLAIARKSRQAVEPASNDMPAREAMALGVLGVILFVTRLGMSSIAPPAVPLGPQMPKTATRASMDLGGQVRLIGYEFSSASVHAGEPLTVTLYWETQGLLLTSYKSFVHVMDSQGQVAAQSDAVPRNWTYPTNGWLPNEWIGDPHTLDLPNNLAGPVEIWAGMYDPVTGRRLELPGDPSGRVRLGIIQP